MFLYDFQRGRVAFGDIEGIKARKFDGTGKEPTWRWRKTINELNKEEKEKRQKLIEEKLKERRLLEEDVQRSKRDAGISRNNE